MEHKVRYYRFAGRLYRDRHFEWRVGYVTESATGYHDPPDKTSFAVQLLDKKNRILVDHPIDVQWGNRPDDPTRAHIHEKIPWHDDTFTLVFMEKDRGIFRVERAENPPQVTFEPDVKSFTSRDADKTIKLEWKSTSIDNKKMFYYLSYSCDGGKTFKPIGSRRTETHATISFSQLPGGKDCLFRLRVTDGLNIVENFSKPFSCPWLGPTAEIHWPQDDEKVVRGSAIEASGQGHSFQERFAEKGKLDWFVNGKLLGHESNFKVKIPDKDEPLSLSLKVTDSQGLTDTVVHKLVPIKSKKL